MRDISAYLTIPVDYVAGLGALRWSPGLDAVEYGEGHTFALAIELVRFLEGFASCRPLMHLGHALHFMHLLRHGDRGEFARMAAAWRDASWPARTAGVLAAALCEGVPAAPNPPTARELGDWLVVLSFASGDESTGTVPPLAPEIFEAHLSRALEGWDEPKLLHWFRHGQGPLDEPGKKLAAELDARKPPSLSDVLAEASRHDRLRAAVPHVARLEGTLALPPRRMQTPKLQLGGYSDIAAKGSPEQLLPSQFALDDLEFLRRWADRELLFFRREEPHRPAAEELVLVLDQGVRTWGAVRLLLAAAAFALARQADGKKKMALRLAATSRSGPPMDPLATVPADVAALLAGSDLSPHPGLALEGVLEGTRGRAVDVVLLTHPRNLAEPDVGAAARLASGPTRLFAVTADDTGEVGIHQVLHGSPVAMGRFRLDTNAPTANSPEQGWTGPLETPGFPFRFGLLGPLATVRLALDDTGRWLLASSGQGQSVLLLMDIDGGTWEILPRATGMGETREILAVAGGFVVRSGEQLVHCDLATRSTKVIGHHSLSRRWVCRRREHMLLGYLTGSSVAPGKAALDSRASDLSPAPTTCAYSLSTGEAVHCPPAWQEGASIVSDDFNLLIETAEGWSEKQPILTSDGALQLLPRPGCSGDPIEVTHGPHPLLSGMKLVAARLCNGILAAAFCDSQRRTLLGVFRTDPSEVLFWVNGKQGAFRYALSHDGRRLAVHRGGAVEVFDTTSAGQKIAEMPMGGSHNNLEFEFGHGWLALWIGKYVHVARWDRGLLEVHTERGDAPVIMAQVMGLKRARRIESKVVSHPRWREVASGPLRARLDYFGNVFLFTPEDAAVAGFFAYQGQFAAWLPDGTRLGPVKIIGGPPSPDAAARIGRAINDAWRAAP